MEGDPAGKPENSYAYSGFAAAISEQIVALLSGKECLCYNESKFGM